MADFIRGRKNTRKTSFRVFLQVLLFESGLADAVDVTGEVEHLVGEAPLGIAAQFPMVLLTFVIRSVSVGYFSLSLIPC